MASIIPAILEQDIREVEQKLNLVKNFADVAQIDICDGRFTDGKTINIEELENIKMQIDVEIHLMVEKPIAYFETCQKIKAKRVFWHYEAEHSVDEAMLAARKFSFKKGITLSPQTNISVLKKSCGCFDAVMLMGVIPGAQGREFIADTPDKISELKLFFSGLIAVDGAVNESNVKTLVAAGATDLAVGSALFNAGDIYAEYEKLRRLAEN